MIAGKTCQAEDCGTLVTEEGCKICRLNLCQEHRTDPSHGCKNLKGDDIKATQDRAREREMDELIATVTKIKLETLVEPLRPGHRCKVHFPDPPGVKFFGLFHVHLLVEFDDGVKWLARIRQTAFNNPDPERGRQIMESEVATQRVLHGLGVKVPNVWTLFGDTQGLNICMTEFVDGIHHESVVAVDIQKMLKTVLDYARNAILRSEVKYPLIGSLTKDNDVGPLILVADDGLPFPGPFRTLGERYMVFIDRTIDKIMKGKLWPDWPVYAYLHQLEVRRMIQEDEEMSRPVSTAYISHGDDHLGNMLVDEQGHITGLIDWEWAFVTSKNEAFAAPSAFYRTLPFHLDCSNKLDPMEAALADAYDQLGRTDLADCVRAGKKYQRLQFAVGMTPWEHLQPLYELFGTKVLGDGTEESFEAAARDKYADDAGLKVLLTRVATETT